LWITRARGIVVDKDIIRVIRISRDQDIIKKITQSFKTSLYAKIKK
jgi:hypothetical protein